LSLCEYCNKELASNGFTYCPHCGAFIAIKEYPMDKVDLMLKETSNVSPDGLNDRTVGAAKLAFKNIAKIPGNTKSMVLKLASNSDSAVDILKDVVDNFDDIPVDFRNELLAKISKGSKDPKLAKVANALITSSPTIAEVVVGFTPLSPYSRVVGKFVEQVVRRQEGGRKIDRTIDSFL
jgi:hypothetical protein